MKRIIMASITAVVVIAVLAGTLIPILDDATATSDTYSNVGYYDLRYTETDDVSLTWDYTKPNQVTINNVEIPLNTTLPGPETILCGDDWFLRYLGTGVQFYGPSGASFAASVSEATSMTVVASNGTAIATNTAETPATKTVSYTYIYCVSNSGDLVMKSATEAAYLNGDSLIYAMGTSTISGTTLGLLTTGTIDDGLTSTVFRGSGSYTVTPTMNPVQDADHIDLYSLESISLAVTGDVTGAALYTYFMVPAEVTAERSVHFTDGENAIFNAIPVIVIVALLLGVLALVLRSRMD